MPQLSTNLCNMSKTASCTRFCTAHTEPNWNSQMIRELLCISVSHFLSSLSAPPCIQVQVHLQVCPPGFWKLYNILQPSEQTLSDPRVSGVQLHWSAFISYFISPFHDWGCHFGASGWVMTLSTCTWYNTSLISCVYERQMCASAQCVVLMCV